MNKRANKIKAVRKEIQDFLDMILEQYSEEITSENVLAIAKEVIKTKENKS